MRYCIEHLTDYRYTHVAVSTQQTLRLSPRIEAHQRVLGWKIRVPGTLSAASDVVLRNNQSTDYLRQKIVEVDVDSGFASQPTHSNDQIFTEIDPDDVHAAARKQACRPPRPGGDV